MENYPRQHNVKISIAITIIFVALIPSLAGYAADAPSKSTAQTVSRIAGAVYQSSAQTHSGTIAISVGTFATAQEIISEPGSPNEITAVCITTNPDVSACGATIDQISDNRTSCNEHEQYDNNDGVLYEPSMYCHGNSSPAYAHPPHVTLCNVDDVGFSKCLEQYRDALVKGPSDQAKQIFRFQLKAPDATLRTVTVLATANESLEEAERSALKP